MKAYKVKVQGMDCYLVEGRIKAKDIPKGFNLYSCVHTENDWSIPAQIQEKDTLANHWGYLLTPKKLKINEFMGFPNKQKRVIYSQEQITI